MADEKKFIPISKPTITQKEVDFVADAVKSTWVSSLGPYIEAFESRFAAFCQCKYAVSVSNGTNALHLALISAGVESGDEVIIPDLTFIATANAVRYINAIPVTVDIEKDTLCICPLALEKAITPKTKAIIPVHLYGHPADMEKINEIAKKHNLIVIEDCAEAHGAEIAGKRVGSFGLAGVFSFYGNKIITTGEGGMITTNDKALHDKMKYLRDHAMSSEKRYWHTEVGYNYRMTNIQAALGVAQFERIEEIIAKKIEIFNWYSHALSGLPNLRMNIERKGYKNIYWMICVELLDFEEIQRDQLMKNLKLKGIDSRPYFYPVSDMPIYENAETPVTHQVSKIGLNLPSYFDLTKDEVIYVCDELKNFC